VGSNPIGATNCATLAFARVSPFVGGVPPHTIEFVDSPGRLGAGPPRQRPIPVILLARLGLDRSGQGTGLGGDLLRDALARCAGVVDDIGGRAVLVHAKDDGAAAFYQRHGLVPLEQNPNHLYVLMKDLRTSIRRSIQWRSTSLRLRLRRCRAQIRNIDELLSGSVQ
jgi:GNAT superfamily N-acetyltransferase